MAPPPELDHDDAPSWRAGSRRRRTGRVAGEEAAGSASERGAISVEQEQHEELLADTADMVAQLKANSLLAQRALASDNDTLYRTDQAVGANVSRVDSEARRIAETRRAMRANCCTTWLLLLVATTLFMFTLFFIRLVPAPKR